MTILLTTENGTGFKIKLDGPAKYELDQITAPDFEGQETARDVWCDRKLKELKLSLLHNDYSYTHN